MRTSNVELRRTGRAIEVTKRDSVVVLGMALESEENGARWTATLFIPRRVAKGILRAVWQEFVQAHGCDGPGLPYAEPPSIQRVPGYFGGWLMEQSGGLDV